MKIAKHYFPERDDSFCNDQYYSIVELGDDSANGSRWILMTKDVLPGTAKHGYSELKKIYNVVKDSLNYKIPSTLTAAACIFSKCFLAPKKSSPDDHTWDSECYKEIVQKYQTIVGNFGLVVGGFGSDGLHVYSNSDS